MDLFGDPIFPQLPNEIAGNTFRGESTGKKAPVDAYNFVQGIAHDPVKELLKAWISLELQKTAHLHFYDFDLEKILESDQLYELRSLVKSVVAGSNIVSVG
ncbi:hypothetical protein BJV82DRAFT_604320 [Fennellomyces sp. T-0311]|nr:hypothetical protein BJV82DRAFT_604320 [Fennellomyces sp. T-0311]